MVIVVLKRKDILMAKKRPHKKRRFRYLPVFLVVFAVFMVYQCIGQIVEINDLKTQQAELEGEYASIMEEREDLQAQKDLLNDETYLERLARENLLMIRDGEYLIVPYEENDEVVDYDDTNPDEGADIH